MCGFSIHLHAPSLKSDNFVLEEIDYRGPDFQKTIDISLKNGWRGQARHSRLSILDCSTAANQPYMIDKNILLFNGEIYNFKALMREFNLDKSIRSDTKVLASLLEENKFSEIIDRLEGQFAIAYIDLAKGKLFLGRDLYGEKPLFYRISENEIQIASDLKCFKPVSLNPNSVNSFLNFGFIPDSECVFKGIDKLGPNKKLEILIDNKKNIPKAKKINRPLRKINFNELVRETAVSDTPTALLLSSGVDSVFTACALANSGIKPDCYTIVYDDLKFNEAKYAKHVCNILGFKHQTIQISNMNINKRYEALMPSLSEPFYDYSSLALSSALEDIPYSTKVIFSGDGGDEMFNGYRRNHFMQKPYLEKIIFKGIASLINKLSKISPDKFEKLSSSQHFLQQIKKLAHLPLYDGAKEYLGLVRANFLPTRTRFSQNSDLLLNTLGECNDINFYLPSDILVKSDRIGMLFNKEIRTIFLHDSFKKCVENEDWFLGFDGKSSLKKYINQTLQEDYPKIPKLGFSLPLSHYINDGFVDMVLKKIIVHESFLKRFFEINSLIFFLKNKGSGQYLNYQEVWTVYCLLIWRENIE